MRALLLVGPHQLARLVTIAVAATTLACGAAEANAPNDEETTLEESQALSENDTLLAHLAAQLGDAPEAPASYLVDGVMLDVSVAAALTPAWTRRIERMRKSLETAGDPERPDTLAQDWGTFRIAKNGRTVGYASNVATAHAASPRCREECPAPEVFGGVLVVWNARGREVARNDWEQ